MRVTHQGFWAYFQQLFEVGGNFFIKSEGGRIFQIADVLAHKGFAPAREAHGSLELSPGAHHAGGVLL